MIQKDMLLSSAFPENLLLHTLKPIPLILKSEIIQLYVNTFPNVHHLQMECQYLSATM